MVLHKPAAIESNPLTLGEIDKPEPGAGEILVRVTACGVCRTDLHVSEGDLAPKRRSIAVGFSPSPGSIYRRFRRWITTVICSTKRNYVVSREHPRRRRG